MLRVSRLESRSSPRVQGAAAPWCESAEDFEGPPLQRLRQAPAGDACRILAAGGDCPSALGGRVRAMWCLVSAWCLPRHSNASPQPACRKGHHNRSVWANIGAFCLNLWMHTLVEFWAWNKPAKKFGSEATLHGRTRIGVHLAPVAVRPCCGRSWAQTIRLFEGRAQSLQKSARSSSVCCAPLHSCPPFSDSDSAGPLSKGRKWGHTGQNAGLPADGACA